MSALDDLKAQFPVEAHEATDAIDRLIQDANVSGAVAALGMYAAELEHNARLPNGDLAIVTVEGVARALRISAARIKRNHEDGRLIADLDPDLDTGGHES